MKKAAFLKALQDAAGEVDNDLRSAEFEWHDTKFTIHARPMNTKRFAMIQKECPPGTNVMRSAQVIAKYCFLDETGIRMFRNDGDVAKAFDALPPEVLLGLVGDLDLGEVQSEEQAEKNS